MQHVTQCNTKMQLEFYVISARRLNKIKMKNSISIAHLLINFKDRLTSFYNINYINRV